MTDWKYNYEKHIEKDINLLFLDIDGVLNFASNDLNNSYNGRFLHGEEIEPRLVKNLNKICKEVPNLKIVISSSWRENMKRTIWALRYAGFNYVENIIGRTPSSVSITKRNINGILFDNKPPYTLLYQYRAEQIMKWILDNPGISKKINNFIIVDDESTDIIGKYGYSFLEKNFIKTNSEIGLSNAIAQDIINHFIGDKHEIN